MARLSTAFKEALLLVKNNRQGRVMRTDQDYVQLDYPDLKSMLTDAQQLNPLGYTTVMNRQMYEMTVTI